MSYKTPYRLAVGEYFHIYNRGVRKSAIFDSDRNYIYFLDRMNARLAFGDTSLICFCPMPNHFHFLVRQNKEDGLSRFMKQLCDGYAKALNKQRGQTGHLFESKYKVRIIDSNEYLIWLSRYIHRNPTEAGLVRRCGEWKFSSYNDFIGLRIFNFVEADIILSQFPSAKDYEKYVEDESTNEPAGVSKYVFDE